MQLRSPARSPAERLKPGRPLLLAGVADGAEGLVLADLARAVAARPNAPAISLAVVCRDGPRMAALSRALGFFAPDIEVLEFPAWDCLPYDRSSPHAGVVAQRMKTLSRLAHVSGRERPAVLLTTVNAALQRVPPRETIGRQSLSAAPGNLLPMTRITQWLELNGFNRASTVREPGDYAVRGGIIDLFAAGINAPVRLDFFGDTLESIRSFDPETQRTTDELRALDLVPMAEFQLTPDTIRLFRTGYVAAFGAAAPDDVLYEAVSEGRRAAGIEHWLPLLHTRLETLFDYLGASSSPSPQGGEGRGEGVGLRGWSPLTPTLSPPGRGGSRRLRSRSSRWPKKPRTSGSRRSPTIIRPARTHSTSRVAVRPISRCRRTGFISPKPNGANGSTMPRLRACRRSPRLKALQTPSRPACTPAITSVPRGTSPPPASSTQ